MEVPSLCLAHPAHHTQPRALSSLCHQRTERLAMPGASFLHTCDARGCIRPGLAQAGDHSAVLSRRGHRTGHSGEHTVPRVRARCPWVRTGFRESGRSLTAELPCSRCGRLGSVWCRPSPRGAASGSSLLPWGSGPPCLSHGGNCTEVTRLTKLHTGRAWRTADAE